MAERESFERAQREAGCDSESTLPEIREMHTAWVFLSEAEANGDAEAAAEWRAEREAVRERLRERCPDGYSFRGSAGEHTKGYALFVMGRAFFLPEDTYIGAHLGHIIGECPAGLPDDAPVCPKEGYVLRRGESLVSFHHEDGTLWRVRLAPGEHDAFAFLDGILDWRPPESAPADAWHEGVLLRSGEMRWTVETDANQ